MKKWLSLLLTLCIVLSGLACCALGEADGTITLTVLHTNDTHGSGISAASESMIRYSQIPAMRDEFENVILIDAGDFSAGTVYASMTDGLASINAMRLLGYDAVVLGNHEFTDSRTAFIEALTAGSGDGLVGGPVAVVNANVTGDGLLESLPQGILVERDGVKVGIFGVTTPSTVITASPSACEGLTFENVSTAAQRCVDELDAQGAEVIICVAHLGYDGSDQGADGITSNAIAANVEGIDVIIDGHAHQTLMGETAVRIGSTLIASTGTAMANVGWIELAIDADTHEVLSSTSAAITAADALNFFPEDETVRGYLDGVVAEVDAEAGEVFANISMALYGGNYTNGEVTASIARRGETNANSMMADAKLAAAKAFFAGSEYEGLPIVALLCGGSCRSSIAAGDVSYADVMSLFLSGGMGSSGLYVKTTGAVLWEAIEWGLSSLTGQDPETGEIFANGSYHGRFPNLAGVSYVYDIRNEPSTPIDYTSGEYKMGSRLVSVTLDDGTQITPDSDLELIFCISSYELEGGDGYYCFAEAEKAGELVQIGEATLSSLDATTQYMAELYEETGDVYYPLNSGRVTVIGDYTAETFESVVTVVDGENAVLGGLNVDFYVNYGEADGAEWVLVGNYTTDASGCFTVELRNGPQETRVVANGVESDIKYVDNYAGLINTTLAVNG